MNREERLLELRPAIAARLLIEGCRDFSPAELRRCFESCAAPEMLLRAAEALIDGGALSYPDLESLAYGRHSIVRPCVFPHCSCETHCDSGDSDEDGDEEDYARREREAEARHYGGLSTIGIALLGFTDEDPTPEH